MLVGRNRGKAALGHKLFEQLLLAAVGIASACALKCSSTVPPPAHPRGQANTTSSIAEAQPRSGRAVAEPAQHAEFAADQLPLGRFYAALHELRSGRRSSHVRVLWLGDSHTAADFWSHSVRKALQSAFGAGGPGFMRVGAKYHRHGLAFLDRKGTWLMQPKPASGTKPKGDGLFGLGGFRVIPRPGATASIRMRPEAVSGPVHWELHYRLPKDATFDVELGERVISMHGTNQATSIEGSPILHLKLSGDGSDSLVIKNSKGKPQIFGIVVENELPGVVVDISGINGARAATPLAWKEGPWVAEVKARQPSLAILAYGTNEAFDAGDVSLYGEHIRELVARVRKAAPESDCLVIGPTDAVLPDGVSQDRVMEIDHVQALAATEVGCAFFSASQAMGGPGSFKLWRALEPPLARGRVHLTPRGYRELGRQLSQMMLDSYLTFASRHESESPTQVR